MASFKPIRQICSNWVPHTRERGFSKLKLIKTYFRTSSRERPNNLVMPSIENDILKTIDFEFSYWSLHFFYWTDDSRNNFLIGLHTY